MILFSVQTYVYLGEIPLNFLFQNYKKNTLVCQNLGSAIKL